MSTSPPVLDTMILQAFAFGHGRGIDVLLQALGTGQARFPSEVYNLDEDREDVQEGDPSLSEFARGIRWARRQLESLPSPKASRYQRWLENLRQLPGHVQSGKLLVDPLTLTELSRREAISTKFGIGRGESACLVLAQRQGGLAILVSSDDMACKAAASLAMPYRTVPELLKVWVWQHRPDRRFVDDLLQGMSNARFSLKEKDVAFLLSLCER